MSIEWKDVTNVLEEKLSEIKTLFLVFFGLFIPFVFIDGFLTQFIPLIYFRGGIYLFVQIIWITYWFFYKFHLPRTSRNKVGIVIALYSENEKERQELKADFISKLRTNLRNEGILEFSEIIFLKNHISKNISESDNPLISIRKKNKKIKAHFYVYGDVKKRENGNSGKCYFLNLNGYVFHNPVPRHINREISDDFTKVLPKQINFEERSSFIGFEVSADIVHLAIRYILGIAAFVSGNPRLAFRLHKELKNQFKKIGFFQEIINKVSLLVSDESLWISRYEFNSRSPDIGEVKKYLTLSLEENDNNYGSWLFKAMLDFLTDKDADAALKSIERARKYSTNTFEWRYSEAFLYFWKDDYNKALSICYKIKSKTYSGEEITIREVRDFNLKLLQTFPEKNQLYFWIGYLSYFKEHNLGNALQDFENFEKNADDAARELLQKSHAYISEIKHKIGIN